MDPLRLAIPRLEYTTEYLLSYLCVIGELYASGKFKELKGGLFPVDYVNKGFYHFGAQYKFEEKEEFDSITS